MVPDDTIFVTDRVWHMPVPDPAVAGDKQSTDLIQDVNSCGALKTLPV